MLTKKKRERRIINSGREGEGKKNHACGNIVNIRAAREWNDSWPFLFYFTASKNDGMRLYTYFLLLILLGEKKEGLPLPLYMERSFFSVVFFFLPLLLLGFWNATS